MWPHLLVLAGRAHVEDDRAGAISRSASSGETFWKGGAATWAAGRVGTTAS